MRVDALEHYNKLGWLDFNVKKWKATDRYMVGEFLRRDYFNAGFEIKTIDPSKPRVDCQGFKIPNDERQAAESRYLNALKYIPRDFVPVVRRVVIENKLIEGTQIEKYALKLDLVRGLDYLCDFYSTLAKFNIVYSSPVVTIS
jgi:hypothetical protein